MTLKINKVDADMVAEDFAAEVEKHRLALLQHRYAAPAQGYRPAIPAVEAVPAVPAIPARGVIPARPGIPGRPARSAIPERPEHPGTPRPTAHPLVDACIVRVPQGPNEPDDFVADYEIFEEVPPERPKFPLPQQKRHLMSMVMGAESELSNKIWPIGKRRLDIIKANAIEAKEDKTRKRDEKSFLKDLQEKQKRLTELDYKAAVLFSEIEDLTEENCHTWTFELKE